MFHFGVTTRPRRARTVTSDPRPRPERTDVDSTLTFVTTHTINPGQLEAVRRLGREFADHVEANEPGLVAFHFYVDDAGTEVSNVQVHPDAATMDRYLGVAEPKIREALQLSATTRIEVFGTPGPLLAQVLAHNVELGAEVVLKEAHVAGFTRSSAA